MVTSCRDGAGIPAGWEGFLEIRGNPGLTGPPDLDGAMVRDESGVDGHLRGSEGRWVWNVI